MASNRNQITADHHSMAMSARGWASNDSPPSSTTSWSRIGGSDTRRRHRARWGPAGSRSNATPRRRPVPAPPRRSWTGLVRQRRPQVSVYPRAGQGAEDHRCDHPDSGAEQREQRTRAGSGDAPAESKDRTPDGVATPAPRRFGCDDDWLADQGADAAPLEHPKQRDRHGERRGKHLVQIQAVEPERFLDAEPRSELALRQHDSEQQ